MLSIKIKLAIKYKNTTICVNSIENLAKMLNIFIENKEKRIKCKKIVSNLINSIENLNNLIKIS